MKKETVNALRQALDAEVQLLGLNNWQAAMEFAADKLRKLTDLLPDQPRVEMESIADAIRKVADILPRLEQLVAEWPELTPSELQQSLQIIEKLGPLHFGRRRSSSSENRSPTIPGRPSVLGTPQEQARIIDEVLALIGKRVKTTDCAEASCTEERNKPK